MKYRILELLLWHGGTNTSVYSWLPTLRYVIFERTDIRVVYEHIEKLP